eukprot:jgi/Botrbrau1/18992/Bobra.0100s0027.2
MSVSWDFASCDITHIAAAELLESETEGPLHPQALALPVPQNAGLNAFANASNIEDSVGYLEAALREIGIDLSLPLGSLLPSDAAVVCNALATVLSQHKRQRAQIIKMGEESNRLQSDVRIALKGKDGMSARLDDALRQLAHFQNQAKVDAEAHKREVEKLVSERDSARTTAADLRQRRSQVEHELRRKELDFERLQKHLRELLSEKEKGERASMATIGKYKGNLARGSQREDDLKKIVSSYEAKLAHARAEVADLRKALLSLQDEHRALINKQVRQAHPAPVLLECDTQTQDQFPASEFVAQPLHEVAQSLQALYARVQEIDTTAGSSISQEELLTSFGSRMFLKQQELIALLKEQQDLASKALALASATENQKPIAHSLDVVDTTISADDTQAGSLRQSCDLGAGESPRSARSEPSGQSHGPPTTSPDNAAWQQLEEEKQALAFKAEEFDKTCETFHELLKQYAPGFGAGSFLFRRIEKASRAAAKKNVEAAHEQPHHLERPMQPLSVNTL